MADQHEVDLDSIIDRLLEVRGSRPGKQVQLLEAEIRYLCTKAREIFISQPILLELEAPIKVRYRTPKTSRRRLTPLLRPRPPVELGARANMGPLPPDLRRYPRPVLRSSAPLRIRWLPSRGELPFPRRLRRPWQAVSRDHLPPSCLQDQVP